MATLKEQFQTRKQNSANQISNLYDKQLAATQQGLTSTYNQDMSDATAAKDAIAPQYQKSANTLAATYERNRRNANMAALNNGLNTGTGLQQQNALRNQYTANYGALRGQELGAIADADKKINSLQTTFQNNMAQAAADSANKKAAALIENENDQNDWFATQAKNLANYGDFSGYENIYGKETANTMKQAWIAQNPLLAYRTGTITKSQYKKMTGKDPV